MRTLLSSNGGCGCGKPKASEVHQPTPKPKISVCQNTNPSTSSTTSGDRNDQLSADDEDFTSTTISETETHHHHDHNNNKKGITKNVSVLPKPSPKIVDTIAVEKESKDPYRDFRYSMLQMIFEREIFSESGLQELLQCFLELNAPCHHKVIVQAFMGICEETFPKKFCGDGDHGDGGGETSCRN